MQLGEISFCDKIGYNIRSDDIKKNILNELESLYKFKVIQRHYDKYNCDIHDAILEANPHMVCTRTNGNPYLLYLTQINNVNHCIFIDKKIQQGYSLPRMILVKMWFEDSLFDNTLFEGEMIKDRDSKWTFLIGDLLADGPNLLKNQNLVKRINRVYQILEKQYRVDTINVCDIKVKKYFYYHELPTMHLYYEKLNYNIRGIYFKPLFLKFKDILYNFDDSLIVSVKRIKMKNQSLFLTNGHEPTNHTRNHNNDDHTLANVNHVSGDSSGSDTRSGSPHGSIDLHSNVNVQIQQSRGNIKENDATHCDDNKTFYAMRTDQADVYELYDDQGNKSIACVNKMSTSKMMQKLFEHATPLTKITMICRFHEKFQKWEPVCLAN